MASPSVPAPPFSERQFYLREFQGRTLGIALARTDGAELTPLHDVVEALAKGGARTVVLAPEAAGLEGLELGPVLAAGEPRLEGDAWRRLRERGRVVIVTHRDAAFAAVCRDLAQRLGLFKLVWVDAGGGLQDGAGGRVSFVHQEELRRMLGEGAPADPRIALWREVDALLEAGVAAVNVCDLASLDDELFSYAGAGTLFTRERYVSVRRLGLDDYDAAHDLLARGVEEGYLAPRTPEQVDQILASGFGAFVEDRHLAGIGALLTRPGSRAGEIASLYTLTRFLGEGIGGDLVAFALVRAANLGFGFVYACTTSERVGIFFERQGFRQVTPDEIPAAKWRDYDPERRPRVRCFRRDLG